jgi:hypothetical protein
MQAILEHVNKISTGEYQRAALQEELERDRSAGE